MSKEYPTIADAFVNARPVPRNSRMFAAYFTPDRDYIGGVNMRDTNAPAALFSYGPHFPIAIEASDTFQGGYWLNESRYAPTENDRYNAGWGMPSTRSPKFSPTTAKQVNAVKSALLAAGYRATDTTKTITTENTDGDATTYTLRLYTEG